MELVRGQVVTSRQGRDVTHTYVVLATEGDRVVLADGDRRTLAAPKRKNIRHIQPTSTVLPPGDTDTDLTLKTALNRYEKARGGEQQGG